MSANPPVRPERVDEVLLDGLTPAAAQGWSMLFDLTAEDDQSYLLIGGQMMYLLAAAAGRQLPRPTPDMDVVVDVRTLPRGTERLAAWLLARGFDMDRPSSDGLGHRFRKAADPGPGEVVVDVLAVEGLSSSTPVLTDPPARSVQAPGATQAHARSSLVPVRVVDGLHGGSASGLARCPNHLGALVIKAAATGLPVRANPERDWQDVALLLALVDDPQQLAEATTKKDRQRLRGLSPLLETSHRGWALLGPRDRADGTATLRWLLGV